MTRRASSRTLRRRRAARLLAVAGGLLSVLATPLPALADDDEDVEDLLDESIVSTASRRSEEASTAPATATVVTGEQMRLYGLRSMDEALSYASLGIYTTQPLHNLEIGSRGVLLTADYGNHYLLLLDGHALNEPWNGTAYYDRGAGIPLQLIDRIEVILGPGSVLYGSHAMLGVINVVTRRGADLDGAVIGVEGDLLFPVERDGGIASPSQGLGFGTRLALAWGDDLGDPEAPIDVIAGLDYYQSAGPSFVLGPQDYGDDAVTGQPKNFGPRGTPGVWGGTAQDSVFTRVPSAYVRAGYGGFAVALRAALFQRGAPYLDNLVSQEGNFDDPDNYEQDRWINLELSHHLEASAVVDLDTRLYGDLYDYHWFNESDAPEDCPAGLAQGCDRDLVGEAAVVGAEARTTLHWRGALRPVTMLGVDARMRLVEGQLDIADPSGAVTLPPYGRLDRTDGSLGAYAEQTLRPTSWLDLNAGLRGDLDQRFGAHASPRAAAAFSVWRGGTLKLIYAEAFRAPSAYEQTYQDPNDQIAAPDLGAESVRGGELTLEQRVSSQRFLMGVFASRWSDMVGYATLTGQELADAIATGQLEPTTTEAYQYRNLARIDGYGYNAGWEGHLVQRRLHGAINVTGAFTRVDPGDGSEPFAPTVGPQFFGNARVSYQLAAPLPSVALAVRFFGGHPTDRAFDGGFTRPPFAPGGGEARVVVGGPTPGLETLAYRVGVVHQLNRKGPYIIGTNQYAWDETSVAERSPQNRLYGFVGLELEL